jgi:hypothetical protein
MAMKGGNRGDNGNTKIRFIMLEAEGNASDLQQIAQAITSAVRPTLIQQVAAPPVMPALTRNRTQPSVGSDPDVHNSVEMVDEGNAIPAPVTKKAAVSTAKRRYPVPSILDLDLTSGDMPFVRFHHEKNPGDHSKRYLVIAAWLKEYRQLNEIGDDHAYTCYRTLSLKTVADIGSVFRSGKKQGWFNSGTQRALFAINHVGLKQVNNLSNGE